MTEVLTAPEHNRERRVILAKLGLDRYLENRTCVDLGDLPVHCELYPSSPKDPVILFIPGIGTYSEIYTEFLSRFSQQGYNLISVDLRGHGYSGGSRGEYTVEEVIEDLGLVLDYADENFAGPVIVFGCSIGARLGLALAEADQRVKALICHTLFISESPPDVMHSLGWNWLSISSMWMPSLKTDFRNFIDVNDLLENNPMGQYADKDDLMVWEYSVKTLNSVFSYPSNILKQSLNIPSMILVGEKDDVITPDYIGSLIKESKHPFDLKEIPGAAHMLPFDHIEECIIECNQWLDNAEL